MVHRGYDADGNTLKALAVTLRNTITTNFHILYVIKRMPGSAIGISDQDFTNNTTMYTQEINRLVS